MKKPMWNDDDYDAPRGKPVQPANAPMAPGMVPGGEHKTFGGAEHMMSPMDAKRLTMMDYRGGRHPYLTRGGAVRKHLKGTGIWDSIKDLAKKAANEVTNPDSLLRGTYAKNAADLAALIPDERAQAFSRAARNVQKGEWADLANKAGEAYLNSQKANDRKKTGQTLGELAQGLKGHPKPKPGSYMSDMAFPMAIEDKPRTYNWSKDFNKPPKPILPGRTRDMLMLEDMPRPSPSQMLMLEDMPRPAHALPKRVSRVDILKAKFAAHEEAKRARRAAEGRGSGARSKRGAMVAKVMRERGVSLPEASRIVKAEGLA
jgi:hypothetical protein